jgi:NACalpha-BTF3-like transcription factor
MCGCNKKNNVALQQKVKQDINLYLIMAKYEVKKKWLEKNVVTTLISEDDENLIMFWDKASQEDLARAYEEFNGGDAFINKIDNSSEKKISKAKKSGKDKGKDKISD